MIDTKIGSSGDAALNTNTAAALISAALTLTALLSNSIHQLCVSAWLRYGLIIPRTGPVLDRLNIRTSLDASCQHPVEYIAIMRNDGCQRAACLMHVMTLSGATKAPS